MPYTQVFIAALKLGYSRRDLAVMPYGEVIFDLAAMSGGTTAKNGQTGDVAVAEATQQDIRTMLG